MPGIEQHLDRRDAPAALGAHQALRYHRLQRRRQVKEQRRPVFQRIEVDDAVHRVVAVVCVQRCQAQMPRLGIGERHGHRLLVADFADEDAIGGLAQRVLQRDLERLGVGADLALVHDRLAIMEDELDRVLEREDVA